jgi:hypothetical protein
MFGLDMLSRGVAPVVGGGLLAAGAVLALVWRRQLRGQTAPLLSFAPAAIPTFAATAFRGSFFRVAIQTAPFMLPLLFQVGFGRSAFSSGLLMLFYAAGNLGMKAITTPLFRRFGFRHVIIVNGIAVALSLVACASITAGLPDWVVAAILFGAGLVRSLQYGAVNTLGFVDVPPALMGAASTLSSMIVQLASAGGIAFSALLLHGIAAARHTAGALDAADLRIAFLLSALLALVATLSLLGLPRDAGAEVSGQAVA